MKVNSVQINTQLILETLTMPKAKFLSKDAILGAMSRTMSNRAAAKFLNVSLIHYRKYASTYVDEATGKTLYELHKNEAGKGIPKFLPDKSFTDSSYTVDDLLNGTVTGHSFKAEKIKRVLISSGRLEEVCAKCGFHDHRVLDFKVPLLLSFKDGDKKNFKRENIELLCYNCYFLNVGDVFTDKQTLVIQDGVDIYRREDKVEWELDDYQKEMLKRLGGSDDDDEISEDDLISRV